jgi:hypothetical protein
MLDLRLNVGPMSTFSGSQAIVVSEATPDACLKPRKYPNCIWGPILGCRLREGFTLVRAMAALIGCGFRLNVDQ